MKCDKIIESNKTYWNDHADLWFGTTALPVYGVRFPTEDDLHLFGDVAGKKMLEIYCGSGHSLKMAFLYLVGIIHCIIVSHGHVTNIKMFLKINSW